MLTVETTINGKSHTLEIQPTLSLLDLIRQDLGLLGTKVCCREGECGSCTVLLDDLAVNSCIEPAIKAHHRNVTTIEGIGTIGSPHPIQHAIADAGGVQCGYCTPGFVISAVVLLNTTSNPSREEIANAIAGNLCRCTGYKRIIEGIDLVTLSDED